MLKIHKNLVSLSKLAKQVVQPKSVSTFVVQGGEQELESC